MATYTITLNASGPPSPAVTGCNPGDQITFNNPSGITLSWVTPPGSPLDSHSNVSHNAELLSYEFNYTVSGVQQKGCLLVGLMILQSNQTPQPGTSFYCSPGDKLRWRNDTGAPVMLCPPSAVSPSNPMSIGTAPPYSTKVTVNNSANGQYTYTWGDNCPPTGPGDVRAGTINVDPPLPK